MYFPSFGHLVGEIDTLVSDLKLLNLINWAKNLSVDTRLFLLLQLNYLEPLSFRSIVSYEGQAVELRCYASGFPLPDIYWRRQNNDILPTNSSVYKVRTME